MCSDKRTISLLTTGNNYSCHCRYLCEVLRLKPNQLPFFYPKLKNNLKTWKAQALWTKLDKKAGHKCYNRGKVCQGTRVLVIGAGPCGPWSSSWPRCPSPPKSSPPRLAT